MLDAKTWKQALLRLVLFARKQEGATPDHAQDLAQQAVTQMLEEGDVTDLESAVLRGISIIRRNEHDARRAARRRRRPQWLGAVARAVGTFGGSPERHASARERSAKLYAELAARTKDDPQVQGLLRQMLGGNDQPAEQAAALGIGISDLRNARKRLSRAVREITEGERGAAGESELDRQDDVAIAMWPSKEEDEP